MVQIDVEGRWWFSESNVFLFLMVLEKWVDLGR